MENKKLKKMNNQNINKKDILKVLNITDEKIIAKALQEYLKSDKYNGN